MSTNVLTMIYETFGLVCLMVGLWCFVLLAYAFFGA